jgi:hypothetical protein
MSGLPRFFVLKAPHRRKRPRHRWISVMECLPRNGRKVLVCGSRKSVFIARHHTPRIWGSDLYEWEDSEGVLFNITHWMSLPRCPRAAKKQMYRDTETGQITTHPSVTRLPIRPMKEKCP